MKKRVLSILLVSIMLLSMLPITALAEASTEPELQMHVRVWNNGQEGVHVVTKDFNYPLYDWLEAKFFLHYPDDTNTSLDITQLGFTSELNCMGVNDEGWIKIQTAALGPGKVVYQTDSATYTVDINVTYPNLGIYTAMPFNVSSLTNTVTVDSAGCIFYIALSPEMQAKGCVMTEVHSAFGSEIDNPSITTIGAVELSDDGSYAAVTVTNAQAEGSYHFEAKVENPNGGPCGTWGRTVSIENNTPRLYYCYADRNDETKSLEIRFEDPKSTWYTTPGSSMRVAFFFGRKSDIRAGRIEPLTMEDLKFYKDLDADDFEDDDYTVPANILRVECTGFNAKAISYTTGGAIYYIDVDTTLPEIGFYTASTPNKSTYIYNQNPFTVTESDRVFYLLPDDTDNIRNISIEEWYDESVKDLFDVSVANDGSSVKFCVKDGAIVPNDGVGIEIQYEVKRHSDSWETRSRSVWVWLKNGQPALMYRRLEWDDEEQEWNVSKRRPLETLLTLSAGDSFPVQFYYGTSDENEPVALSDLTFPAGILRAYMEEDAAWVEGTGFEESGTISYTSEDGGTTTMQVNVTQPDFGFYSSTVPCKATYLGKEVPVSSPNDAFYIVTGQNCTILDIEAIENNQTGEDATNRFAVTIDKQGEYACIQMKQDTNGNLPAEGDYTVLIEQDWGTRYLHFKLIRNDLPQLSTPTDLAWHRQYHWDATVETDYQDRMGAMSFKAGELVQNRFTVEIYSAADNYTTPVASGSWRFGDMDHSDYFTLTDFIYEELPSGTYKFRVRADGDGTKYRDSEWSGMSPVFQYTEPKPQLTAPDEDSFEWRKGEYGYFAVWAASGETGAGYYEVHWYYRDAVTGRLERTGSTFDIPVEDAYEEARFHDEILEEHGAVPYYFKVRVIPSDMTQYRISEWSGFSEALDTQTVTDRVNQELNDLLSEKKLDVEDVQEALENQTADLHTAMAADLELSGGTLEKIRELENKVADSVTQEVEAQANAPQPIKDIAGDITMIGATLNLASKEPTSTVTLELSAPEKGIVIDEQQHNAVQFSMKLNGAVDKDDEEQAGQQLIVPVVIDMPVPAGINPNFLVVLHQHQDGSIEQIRPYIYWNADKDCWHARFVVDSFSDFAFVEYNFRFETDAVSKQVGDRPFCIAALGHAEDSNVIYTSSDPDIAAVDGATGEVTIRKAGTVIITASASATSVYPEAECSYTLTVTEAPAPSQSPVSPTMYKVNVIDSNGGNVTVSSKSPKKGDKVTIIPKPEDGYTVEQILVTDKNGDPVEVTNNGDGTYSFTQPAGNVNVKVTFMEDNTMLNFFVDVPANAYYYDAVLWAVKNGITYGTSDTTFSPSAPCTRAQIVTFLWRVAGSPGPKGVISFTDVPADVYYAKAVAWAVENGITSGVGDSKFAPDEVCTRAQMATFLCRMAGGKAVSSTIAFTDVSVDAYYAEAVQWAVESGITKGTGDGTTFSPDEACTRGQMVTFLYRFFVK